MTKFFKNIPHHLKNLIQNKNYIHLIRWRVADGDNKHRLNYPLKPTSIVFDVGGFKGEWAKHIHEKYGAHIHIFEPLDSFIQAIQNTHGHNNAIKIHPYGLGDSDKTIDISIDGDASSTFATGQNTATIQIKDITAIIADEGIQNIDLIKLNVEGAEYEILNRLIESGDIKKINHLQIQFHDFVDDVEDQRRNIRQKLKQTHTCQWNYPFVWEGWKRIEK